jgi:hypothetical protein
MLGPPCAAVLATAAIYQTQSPGARARGWPLWLSDSYFAKIAGSRTLFPLAANLMSFHRQADEKIKEAFAKGEFDNLPGKGKPLDLDAYFTTPEHLRMGYSILKSADIIPEEMELLKQIEGLKTSLDSCTSQIEKRAIQKQLSEKITNFNLRMERYRKKRS